METKNEPRLEEVPQIASETLKRVENIERLLLNHFSNPQIDLDRWFNLTEFCDYHPNKPAKVTAYGWVSNSEVPFHKNGDGKGPLRFLKSEVDLWLKQGGHKAASEIANEAEEYLKKKRG